MIGSKRIIELLGNGLAIHSEYHKDSQMSSPSLLSGPKIRKAYFETSNPKMLQILMGVYKVN